MLTENGVDGLLRLRHQPVELTLGSLGGDVTVSDDGCEKHRLDSRDLATDS